MERFQCGDVSFDIVHFAYRVHHAIHFIGWQNIVPLTDTSWNAAINFIDYDNVHLDIRVFHKLFCINHQAGPSRVLRRLVEFHHFLGIQQEMEQTST